MRRPLTLRERRGAALLTLAVVLGAAYWLLIDSWFAGPLRAMGEQAEQLREQQQRYASVIRQGDALREQLARAGEGRPTKPCVTHWPPLESSRLNR